MEAVTMVLVLLLAVAVSGILARLSPVKLPLPILQIGIGALLFIQGDRAEALWWLESGQIKLYRLPSDGHQKIMGLVAPRQSFVEGVLFMDARAVPSTPKP